MKRTLSVALALAAGLALSATLSMAHPGGGWGPGNGAGPGSGRGMGYGMMGGGMGGCLDAQGNGPFAGQPLFTVEEMNAHRDSMRNATTVEQRQQLMTAHRTEMQRRAGERGITCPGVAAAPAK